MQKRTPKPGQTEDPVIVFESKNQTLIFDNLNDVKGAENLIAESNVFAEAIVNGDLGERTMRSAGEYSGFLHAEVKRHKDRAEAYRSEYGEPKAGSIPARLLQSSAECCEQMLDAVLGLDYIVATKGKGPVIGETARLN